MGGSALVERGTTLNEADAEMNVGSQRFTWTSGANEAGGSALLDSRLGSRLG